MQSFDPPAGYLRQPYRVAIDGEDQILLAGIEQRL